MQGLTMVEAVSLCLLYEAQPLFSTAWIWAFQKWLFLARQRARSSTWIVSESLFPVLFSLLLPLRACKKQEMMSFFTKRRFFECIYFIWINTCLVRPIMHLFFLCLLFASFNRQGVSQWPATDPHCRAFWQRDSKLKQLSMEGEPIDDNGLKGSLAYLFTRHVFIPPII